METANTVGQITKEIVIAILPRTVIVNDDPEKIADFISKLYKEIYKTIKETT